jgi:hypothetical protein
MVPIVTTHTGSAMLLSDWLRHYRVARSTYYRFKSRYVECVKIGKNLYVPGAEVARFEQRLNDAVKPQHGGARAGAGRPRKVEAGAAA